MIDVQFNVPLHDHACTPSVFLLRNRIRTNMIVAMPLQWNSTPQSRRRLPQVCRPLITGAQIKGVFSSGKFLALITVALSFVFVN
jgi:hypothetical protein